MQQERVHGAYTQVALAAIGCLFLALLVLALRNQAPFFWITLPVLPAVWLASRVQRNQQSAHRMWRLHRFYQRSIRRVQGDWVGEGATGEEFCDSNHAYAKDLNVFGNGSLFELLCTTRTSIGQHGLADYLLTAASREGTLLRQEAVRELRDRLDLRERLALLGEFEFCESKWQTFSDWLDAPFMTSKVWLRFAAFCSSLTLLAIVLILAPFGWMLWSSVPLWIGPIVGFHLIVGWVYGSEVRRILILLRSVSAELQVLREALQLLEEQQFECIKLRQLCDNVRNSTMAVSQLERLLRVIDARNKELFYAPSLFLLLGTQLCMAVEHWRMKHAAEFRVWLDAWAEFEALHCLATYASENPDHIFPTLVREGPEFEAEELGHPLISGASCIRNNVRLNAETKFYLVSGSNMSGKSTFLRAIGLNGVLALAGAPVRARSLRLSQLSICASLSVVDSLLSGKSKFMAEMDRLRHMIEESRKSVAVLFLIDEIFSGTNSQDRRAAAEAVLRTLVNRGATGALSTHDLALSEIPDSEELHGINMHMGSRDGTDPMDFDYRLKAGVTRETNALAIARMAGVPV